MQIIVRSPSSRDIMDHLPGRRHHAHQSGGVLGFGCMSRVHFGELTTRALREVA